MTTQSDQPKANNAADFVDGKVRIVVKVIKAEELKCEGKEPDRINPYVAVTLGSDPNQKFKTKPVKHNPNPQWNERFEFNSNDLENEVIFVDMKHKGQSKNITIMKRVKISFLSFKYGEKKSVEKELHWKDEYVGRLYLEISLKGKGKQKSDADKPKATSKADKGICFKVLAVEGSDLKDAEYSVQLKMNSDESQSPTTSAQKGTDPKWNEELYIKTKDATNDTLRVNLLRDGKRCIKPITFQTSEYSVGQKAITFDDDVYNKNDNKVGHLKLKITPLDYNANVKTRDIKLGQKCEFSLGDYSSEFSTTFTSLTSSFQQSVSDLRSDEDNLHPHHDVEPDTQEKPCRYDNVKGSLTSLSDLVDVGSSSSKVYVTLDVLSMGKAKKIKTRESDKVDSSETPQLSFDFHDIKKGNTLVFNIWKTVSGSDDANIGVVEIPVKDIPENKDKKITRDIQKPRDFSYGENDSFGKAVFQLNHTVDYRLPYSNDDEED